MSSKLNAISSELEVHPNVTLAWWVTSSDLKNQNLAAIYMNSAENPKEKTFDILTSHKKLNKLWFLLENFFYQYLLNLEDQTYYKNNTGLKLKTCKATSRLDFYWVDFITEVSQEWNSPFYVPVQITSNQQSYSKKLWTITELSRRKKSPASIMVSVNWEYLQTIVWVKSDFHRIINQWQDDEYPNPWPQRYLAPDQDDYFTHIVKLYNYWLEDCFSKIEKQWIEESYKREFITSSEYYKISTEYSTEKHRYKSQLFIWDEEVCKVAIYLHSANISQLNIQKIKKTLLQRFLWSIRL